jgi:hypothetical protein
MNVTQIFGLMMIRQPSVLRSPLQKKNCQYMRILTAYFDPVYRFTISWRWWGDWFDWSAQSATAQRLGVSPSGEVCLGNAEWLTICASNCQSQAVESS